MLNKIKKLFSKEPEPKAEPPKMPKVKKPIKELSEKEKATAAGEPYIAILKVEVDPNDIHNGSFELDWNDKFLLNLIRAGYKQKETDTDDQIIDRWFQTVARNIALEMYQQVQADPEKRDVRYNLQSRRLDDGRTEIS